MLEYAMLFNVVPYSTRLEYCGGLAGPWSIPKLKAAVIQRAPYGPDKGIRAISRDLRIIRLQYLVCLGKTRSESTIMSQPEITVLYFAAASTATGLTEQSVTLPASQYPLSSLSGFLESLHPDVGLDKILQSSQWSVNAEMVDNVEEVILKGGEEVAIICPVSGG